MSIEQLKFKEDLLKCVKCGGCKALCPTYDKDSSEGMGARGRLVLVNSLLNGDIKPSPLLNERIFSCILCNACSGLCPLKVDIIGAIYHGRALLNKNDNRRKYLRLAAKLSVKWPELSFRILRMLRHNLLPALSSRGVIPFTPELPSSSFRSSEQLHKVSQHRGRVAIFTGCSVNFIFPFLAESLINVLKKLRYEVIVPKGMVCCGAPLRSLGLEKEAAALAKKNLRVFNKLKVEAILSLCPTCTMSLKTEYPKIAGEGLDKAMDISVFFKDKIDTMAPNFKTAVYHDPCHLYYGLGVSKEPRELIRKSGIGLIDEVKPECCGFGGTFCFSNKKISEELLTDRAKQLKATGADTVITSCPGCMLQLGRMITDRPVLHLIELIEEAYCYRTAEKKERGKKQELSLFE